MILKSLSTFSVYAALLTACQTQVALPVTEQPNATANTTPRSMTPLVGSEWGLKESASGKGDIFLTFKEDGRAVGSGGCNRFSSAYDFNAQSSQGVNALVFSRIGSTKKLCGPERMQSEQALFGALGNTRGAEFSHLTLKLLSKDGTPLLTLRRRDWD